MAGTNAEQSSAQQCSCSGDESHSRDTDSLDGCPCYRCSEDSATGDKTLLVIRQDPTMTVKVTTRHSEDFDIHTETIDPAKSPYADTVCDYVAKIKAFYTKLGIHSAMWTTPATEPPKYLETSKPVEYLLELDDDRVVAYVNENTWSDYLYDKRETVDYSTTPTQYAMTSILVATPITKTEVKAIRWYRRTNGPDRYELVKEITF